MVFIGSNKNLRKFATQRRCRKSVANSKPALRKITDKTAVKNITDPLSIWNDEAKVKLRPKYITFDGFETPTYRTFRRSRVSDCESTTDHFIWKTGLKLRSCHTLLE